MAFFCEANGSFYTLGSDSIAFTTNAFKASEEEQGSSEICHGKVQEQVHL